MEVNKFVTMTVGLIVGVLLVSGLMVPVISSVSSQSDSGSDGEIHTNPDTWLKMSYATEPVALDISFSISQNWEITIISNGTMSTVLDTSDLEGNFPSIFVPLFLSEDIYIGQIEGWGAARWSDQSSVEMLSVGSEGTIVSEGNSIIITMAFQGNEPTTVSIPFPSWYYYADAEGDYGFYNRNDFAEGMYASDTPLCPFSFVSDVYNPVGSFSTTGMLYGDHYYDPGSSSHSVSPVRTDADGKVVFLGWNVDGTDMECLTAIYPLSVGGGSGSGGLSPTLIAMLSIIPLITVVGIIIGTIGYLRFKE